MAQEVGVVECHCVPYGVQAVVLVALIVCVLPVVVSLTRGIQDGAVVTGPSLLPVVY